MSVADLSITLNLDSEYSFDGNYSVQQDISLTALNHADSQMEDGELKDIQSKEIGAILTKRLNEKTTIKQYLNKAEEFVVGIDLFSEEAKAKAEERIRRFGQIIPPENLVIDVNGDDALKGLYKSLGVNGHQLLEGTNIRFGVIHMKGTEELSTEDIFLYFKEFVPTSIEWIDDHSCNIVWLETESAARALLKLSIEMKDGNDPDNKVIGNEKMDVDLCDDDGKSEMTIRCDGTSPPNGKWRLGKPHPKSRRQILMRFATTDDKKQVGANNKSKYYIKHGNPNYGGLKGLLTKGCKQRMRNQQWTDEQSNNNNNINNNIKNTSTRKRNFFDEETKFDVHVRDVDRRRKVKVAERLERVKDGRTNEWDNEDHIRGVDGSPRSKVPRMRMYADEEDHVRREIKGRIWERLGCHNNEKEERSNPYRKRR